jgi:hypothetical protein
VPFDVQKFLIPGDMEMVSRGEGIMGDNLLFAAIAVLMLMFAGGITSAQNPFRIRRRHH